MYYKTQGIIVKKFDVGEADKILTIYTQDYGKIRAMAKGSRRPKSKMGGQLDILNLANLALVQGKSFDRITGCETVRTFRAIKNNLDATAQMYLAFEFFDQVIHVDQKDEILFDTLVSYLDFCDTHAGEILRVRLLTSAFLVKCLSAIGVLPPTDRCAHCSREFDATDTNIFTNELFQGFFCASCARGKQPEFSEISVGFVKAINFFSHMPFARIAKLDVTEERADLIDRLVRLMASLHVQKRLTAPRLIAELSRADKIDIM